MDVSIAQIGKFLADGGAGRSIDDDEVSLCFVGESAELESEVVANICSVGVEGYGDYASFGVWSGGRHFGMPVILFFFALRKKYPTTL
mmetsp:Transcript_29913/g.59947  ORF Transcript_29913/g.59947 Transcript_29913/m.59947 type:complete len:88 (-) Transcript_29913:17-280(-)